MQRGFIQIPILIAVLIGAAVLGGTGYVAYEVGQKSSRDTSESTTATTTTEIQATTTEDSGEVETTPAESDVETAKEQTQNTQTEVETNVATQQKVETPVDTSVDTEVIPPPAKNFKEPVLASIDAQIDSYKAITSWIDSDMMPLLSQRESMLNGLISSTNSLIASESDPSVDYAYGLFVDAYNLDKSQIVDFYRDIFSDIKNHINNEKISKLNTEYAKFSAKSFVSEAEYNAEIQALAQYESDWKSLYNDGVKLAMTQYMSQTDAKDEMYQRLWSELSAAVSDLKNTQALESKLNQLYVQQPKPLNCTFSSHYNGFGTVGSLNCY